MILKHGRSVHSVLSGSSLRDTWFADDDITVIKTRIAEFENGTAKRNNGGKLLRHLTSLNEIMTSLLQHFADIERILRPPVIVQRTVEEALAVEQQVLIHRHLDVYSTLPEAIMRTIAQAVLGDIQENYTKEELPFVVATKHVSGELLAVEEIPDAAQDGV